MKKLLLIVLLLSLLSARSGNPRITCSDVSANAREGYEYVSLELRNAELSPSPSGTIVWYAYNIPGMAKINYYSTAVLPSGNIATVACTPIYTNGDPVTVDQTLTTGTAITDIRSVDYKFTLTNIYDVTQNVSANFVIAD